MLDTLTNPGVALTLLLIGFSAVFFAKGRRWLEEYRQFQAWRLAGMPQATQVLPTATEIPSVVIDPTPLPSVSGALANPPKDLRVSLDYMRQHYPNAKYQFPLGWRQSRDGSADLLVASFVQDVNHILLTGQSDCGKDNVALNIVFALTAQYRPEQLQVAIVDGKGLDWAGWTTKAHTWDIALKPEDISGIMQALSEERRRRLDILQAAGVSKWDEYTGGDLPLLVVYVAELLLLENATSSKELTNWLNAELTAARAFGIRYIIACQTASNFATQWRSQVSLFLAGFQPGQHQDQPNTNISTTELESLGATPPSRLPNPPAGAGLFTAVQGRTAFSIRASYLSSQQRQWLLNQLPAKKNALHPVRSEASTIKPPTVQPDDMQALLEALHKGQPLLVSNGVANTTALGRSNGLEARYDLNEALQEMTLMQAPHEAAVISPEIVPPEEQKKILEAASRLPSRRKVCQEIFGSVGGAGYEKVRMVLDAAGLLVA